MSLQGKIEAIIYAAEEPVTLDQLALLLKRDVLSELEAEAASKSAVLFESTAEHPHQDATESSDAPSEPAEQASGSTSSEPGAELSQSDINSAQPTSDNDEQLKQSSTLPEALTETSTGSEEPSEARQHPERAPESQEPLSVPESTSSSEPLTGSASVNARAAVAAKKKKAADPELARVKAHLRGVMETVIAAYETDDRGVEIRQIAGGYRMATKPEHHDLVRAFAKSLKPPIKLSLQALETLAIIAYKQPVTGPEIAEIRGVDSGGVLGTLLDRKLITTAGRKQVIGRPMQYKTTKEFLLRFGMNDLNELPSMEEFEKLAQDQTDMFSPDVPVETGTAPSDALDEVGDTEPVAETAPSSDGNDMPEGAGDYSSGADTSETIVREQVTSQAQSVSAEARNHQGASDSAPQQPPYEPAEPTDAGDFSSGADASETIVREQLEEQDKRS